MDRLFINGEEKEKEEKLSSSGKRKKTWPRYFSRIAGLVSHKRNVKNGTKMFENYFIYRAVDEEGAEDDYPEEDGAGGSNNLKNIVLLFACFVPNCYSYF